MFGSEPEFESKSECGFNSGMKQTFLRKLGKVDGFDSILGASYRYATLPCYATVVEWKFTVFRFRRGFLAPHTRSQATRRRFLAFLF